MKRGIDFPPLLSDLGENDHPRHAAVCTEDSADQALTSARLINGCGEIPSLVLGPWPLHSFALVNFQCGSLGWVKRVVICFKDR